MKRVLVLSLIMIVAFNFSSCKSEKKSDSNKKNEVKKNYVVASAKSEINFTAYKTSEKIPVRGQFKKVDIIANGEGNTIKEAINNVEFSIPVSSIFTKDTSRDFKIKKFFFGVMDNTKLLSGKLVIENDSIGYANIKMNGKVEKVSFSYSILEKTFSMNATMNLENWNAVKAINSLNLECKDLHKGTDGVSKTWNEVALNITTTF